MKYIDLNNISLEKRPVLKMKVNTINNFYGTNASPWTGFMFLLDNGVVLGISDVDNDKDRQLLLGYYNEFGLYLHSLAGHAYGYNCLSVYDEKSQSYLGRFGCRNMFGSKELSTCKIDISRKTFTPLKHKILEKEVKKLYDNLVNQDPYANQVFQFVESFTDPKEIDILLKENKTKFQGRHEEVTILPSMH